MAVASDEIASLDVTLEKGEFTLDNKVVLNFNYDPSDLIKDVVPVPRLSYSVYAGGFTPIHQNTPFNHAVSETYRVELKPTDQLNNTEILLILYNNRQLLKEFQFHVNKTGDRTFTVQESR